MLNHPNIAHIHGLEESGGVRARVMELIDGDEARCPFPTGGDTHLVPVFDVTPDGQHFLMLRSRGRQHVALIFNWPSDLARIGTPSASSER